MSGREERYTSVAATIAGSVAGAVTTFAIIDVILQRLDGGPVAVIVGLAGWLALSSAAGAASYAAAAPFSRHALPIAISVFVWIGLLVYPGIVVHAVFDIPVDTLVLGGAALAGLGSALLVDRIEPA